MPGAPTGSAGTADRGGSGRRSVGCAWRARGAPPPSRSRAAWYETNRAASISAADSAKYHWMRWKSMIIPPNAERSRTSAWEGPGRAPRNRSRHHRLPAREPAAGCRHSVYRPPHPNVAERKAPIVQFDLGIEDHSRPFQSVLLVPTPGPSAPSTYDRLRRTPGFRFRCRGDLVHIGRSVEGPAKSGGAVLHGGQPDSGGRPWSPWAHNPRRERGPQRLACMVPVPARHRAQLVQDHLLPGPRACNGSRSL